MTPEQLAEQDAQQQQYFIQHYGDESANATQRELVTRVGAAIVTRSDAKDSKKTFRFHLLAESNLIDSFAVPTGDVYVTTALVNRLHTEGQLAAVLAGGIAHVLAGHHMHAPDTAPDQWQFTAAQETSADARTIKFMAAAGYDPNALLGLFAVLTDAYTAHADVPFFTTHPSAPDRLTTVATTIKTLYPQGVPAVLSK